MLIDRFRMDGQVAIVTGAGRGIGAAIAVAFAEAGADVVIGSRSRDQLEEVAGVVEGLGQRAVVVDGDLSSRDALSSLVDTALSEFGRLTCVVNNVGGSMPAPFMDTSETAFERAFHWNVTTAFNLSQLAVPHLLAAGGGTIINIASTAGVHNSRGFTAYGTAKAAMLKLTAHMAQDLAPRIRVNAIAPGAIATSALEIVLTNDELHQAMVAGTPLRRLGEAEDIAAAALYLASPASGYLTGDTIRVDGGIQGSNLELGLPDLG
jgi:7-alpha-hydroxysteroid dehydrogenase